MKDNTSWKGLATAAYSAYKTYKGLPKMKFEYSNRTEYAAESTPAGQSKSLTKVVVNRNKMRGHLKGNTVTYHDSYQYEIACPTGREKLTMLGYLGTRAQFLSGTTYSGATSRASYSFASWFSLNPLAGVAEGAITTGSVTPENDKIGAGRAQIYMDLINCTNIPTFVKIHFFRCMDDSNTGPLYAWTDVGATGPYKTDFEFTASGTVPAATSKNGNAEGVYVYPTDTVAESLSVAPYTNITSKRTVSKQWKKIKTVGITLTGADTHRLTCLVDLNMVAIRENLLMQNTFPVGCLAWAIEQQGAAVIESGVGPTLGSTKIGVAVTRKVSVLPMKSPNARVHGYYQAQALVQGGAVTTNVIVQPSLSATQIGVTI